MNKQNNNKASCDNVYLPPGLYNKSVINRGYIINTMEKPVMVEYLGFMRAKPSSRDKEHFALYKCSCGNLFRARTHAIDIGKTKSCGCLVGKQSAKWATKHGMSRTGLYRNVWQAMKERCYVEGCSNYCYYGARGIIVCEEWRNDFMSFYNWAMDNGYKKGLQIDRIDTDGNYEPLNCRWVTPSQNGLNRRRFIIGKSGYKGVRKQSSTTWSSNIFLHGRHIYIGSFNTAEEAAAAYNNYAIEHNTGHKLNIINTCDTQ